MGKISIPRENTNSVFIMCNILHVPFILNHIKPICVTSWWWKKSLSNTSRDPYSRQVVFRLDTRFLSKDSNLIVNNIMNTVSPNVWNFFLWIDKMYLSGKSWQTILHKTYFYFNKYKHSAFGGFERFFFFVLGSIWYIIWWFLNVDLGIQMILWTGYFSYLQLFCSRALLLTAPSHYLNQWCLISGEVLWHSSRVI